MSQRIHVLSAGPRGVTGAWKLQVTSKAEQLGKAADGPLLEDLPLWLIFCPLETHTTLIKIPCVLPNQFFKTLCPLALLPSKRT